MKKMLSMLMVLVTFFSSFSFQASAQEKPLAYTEEEKGQNKAAYGMYKKYIDSLINEYGEIRISDTKYKLDDCISDPGEINGLCYLALLDMDNNNEKELFAVYKDESELNYSGMIYSIIDGKVQCVKPINNAASNNNDLSFNIKIRRHDNRDYIIVTQGVNGIESRTIYGYIDGQFGEKTFSYETDGQWDQVDFEFCIDGKTVTEEEYDNSLSLWGLGIDGNSAQIMDYVVRGDKSLLELELLKDSISDTLSFINGESTSCDAFPDPNWKKAYRDYIQGDKNACDATTYTLCFIDYDHIPDIAIDYGVEALGTSVITYQKGKVIVQNFPRLGGLHYIPYKGLIYNSTMQMGVMTDVVYKFDGEQFSLLGSGQRTLIDDSGNEFTFKWSDQDVDETDYFAHLNELFDINSALHIDSPFLYTQESVCDQLSE